MATRQVREEIAINKRIVSQLKREIRAVDPSIDRRYIREFREEFRRIEAPSSWDDLVIACFKSDIVYIGDYHTLPSTQEFAARLIKEVASRSREVILAMEMVYGRNQRALDQWMSGGMSDDEFRRRIRYDLDWGYEWDGFGKIFQTARDYGVRVLGIDCPPRSGLRYIHRRDRYAAARIADVFHRNPGARVIAVIGESHLATGHLPCQVRLELARRNLEKRSVRVVQNLEEIYWQLIAQGEEHRDVVSVGRNAFCVFNASPIAKYESYRQTIGRWRSQQADDDSLDLTPTIHNMVDTILRFLGVDKYARPVRSDGDCTEYLVDYYPEVYSDMEVSQLRRLLVTSGFSRREIMGMMRQVRRSGSCYIPRINSIFIGQFNLVHGGEEASHFVNYAMRGDVTGAQARRMSRPDLFYSAVLEEALGYFGSKLIDPSRNHFFETDLYRFHRKDKAFIEANTKYTYEQFRAIIRFIVVHKRFERAYGQLEQIPREISEGLGTRDEAIFSVLTHELGYYLGQQIYDGYHQGAIQRHEVASLFTRRYLKRGSALKAYLDLVEKLPESIAA